MPTTVSQLHCLYTRSIYPNNSDELDTVSLVAQGGLGALSDPKKRVFSPYMNSASNTKRPSYALSDQPYTTRGSTPAIDAHSDAMADSWPRQLVELPPWNTLDSKDRAKVDNFLERPSVSTLRNIQKIAKSELSFGRKHRSKHPTPTSSPEPYHRQPSAVHLDQPTGRFQRPEPSDLPAATVHAPTFYSSS